MSADSAEMRTITENRTFENVRQGILVDINQNVPFLDTREPHCYNELRLGDFLRGGMYVERYQNL